MLTNSLHSCANDNHEKDSADAERMNRRMSMTDLYTCEVGSALGDRVCGVDTEHERRCFNAVITRRLCIFFDLPRAGMAVSTGET
jgi:hypothetical protein